MNLATMLSGDWTKQVQKIRKAETNTIAIARKRRSDAKLERMNKTVQMVDSGKSINDIAIYFGIHPGTVIVDLKALVKDCRISADKVKAMIPESSNRNRYEKPVCETQKKIDMIYLMLTNKSMTKKELMAALDLKMGALNNTLRHMDKSGMIGKFGKCPIRIYAVRP
jgi:predicted transcriptional regulator